MCLASVSGIVTGTRRSAATLAISSPVPIGGSTGFVFWGRAGGYLPSLSINYINKSKDMEKRLQQLCYIKMKISYDLGFITTESLWQRYDAITFFIYLCISLY